MKEIPLFRSRMIDALPDVRFAMSTRSGGVSPPPLGMNLSFNVGDEPENVRKNREIFFGAIDIPAERVAFPGQIHGDVVQEAVEPAKVEACDALMTDRRGLYLAISVADCIPIFLYDDVGKAVAAVHAGWRGTEKGIVKKTVEAMSVRFATEARNLLAVIGPGAGVCCYEVGEEVAALFPAEFVNRSGTGHPRLDLKRRNRELLIEAGVMPQNIEISGDCTICGAGQYHSFRRDGARSGRMLGVIGITQVPS